MKKTAVLLDLGFVLHRLHKPLGDRDVAADDIRAFAVACLRKDEELLRIYCYHCPPYDQVHRHPLTKQDVDFAQTLTYGRMDRLLRELSLMDYVALRSGEIIFTGWVVKKLATKDIAATGRALTADDFRPDLRQKRVDIKIGLDVAWLSSKSIVDRILLVTADTDFVPAMKFARREGVQVILVPMGKKHLSSDLRIHADEVREVQFTPQA